QDRIVRTQKSLDKVYSLCYLCASFGQSRVSTNLKRRFYEQGGSSQQDRWASRGLERPSWDSFGFLARWDHRNAEKGRPSYPSGLRYILHLAKKGQDGKKSPNRGPAENSGQEGCKIQRWS